MLEITYISSHNQKNNEIFKLIHKNMNGTISIFQHEIKEFVGNQNWEYFKNNFNLSQDYGYVCVFENENDIQNAIEWIDSWLVIEKLTED